MNTIWSTEVDAVLKKGTYLGIAGIRNWAFPREQALSMADRIEQLGIAILGGDVLVAQDGTFKYTYDNWHCDKTPVESESDYVKRSSEVAKNYITNYLKSENHFLFSMVPNVCPPLRIGNDIDEGLFDDVRIE